MHTHTAGVDRELVVALDERGLGDGVKDPVTFAEEIMRGHLTLERDRADKREAVFRIRHTREYGVGSDLGIVSRFALGCDRSRRADRGAGYVYVGGFRDV